MLLTVAVARQIIHVCAYVQQMLYILSCKCDCCCSRVLAAHCFVAPDDRLWPIAAVAVAIAHAVSHCYRSSDVTSGVQYPLRVVLCCCLGGLLSHSASVAVVTSTPTRCVVCTAAQ